NLTKFGQSISRLATNFINNLKSGLRFLNRSKIVVRILLLENQELIVNSQPQNGGTSRKPRALRWRRTKIRSFRRCRQPNKPYPIASLISKIH
ncbi:hypothetical protein CP361_07420, partial [Lactobacillus sp. UMNPBX10]